MKSYAIVEISSNIDLGSTNSLTKSTIRKILKLAPLPAGSNVVRTAIISSSITNYSDIDAAFDELLCKEYHVQISTDIGVDVVAVSVDDAISKVRELFKDDPSFGPHSKPEWWEFKVCGGTVDGSEWHKKIS